MARFVDDVALAYRLISGPGHRDHLALPFDNGNYLDLDIKDLMIGYWFSESDG
jgi:hypothetical protein